jgi:hypothetical protein
MNFQINNLPVYGKTFVKLFCILVLIIIAWMTLLGLMYCGFIGTHDEQCVSESTVQMETMLAGGEAVTDSVWDDTTQAIDDEIVRQNADGWTRFQENVEWALEHAGTQALLFFALGFLLSGTAYSDKAKKSLYWLGFVLIVLHVVALSGHGFCTPANVLMYVTGPLLLIVFFIMDVMILSGLKKV